MVTTQQATNIAQEFLEVITDFVADLKQQLSYYRASVYKAEAVHLIEGRINDIYPIMQLVNVEEFLDTLADYQALKDAAMRGDFSGMVLSPGDCSVSFRVSKLISQLDLLIKQTQQDFSTQLMSRLEKSLSHNKQEFQKFAAKSSRRSQPIYY